MTELLQTTEFTIASETAADVPAREALLDRAMGEGRFRKSSETLRRGRMPAEGLAFAARDEAGTLIGTVRLWHVEAGIDQTGTPVPALLLGPLAVAPEAASLGIGSALMCHAIAEAKTHGHRAILLVGDAPYYARFGFSAEKAATLTIPGPFERARFLGLELVEEALEGASGMLVAAGVRNVRYQAADAA
ncbi:GNAT family N-acetyltransferase [Pararhizobium mangrovi]|uniref:N-acetyltransferase n=1 Tax=Pararhizobium mangrovi TaxID=2590452 RepID=A0A506U8K8_9HYPH|nr:N-acetyltransferase [Pararhizobium mangrovi]TPW30683.1 N-acetyltransferase [Pararhizobium mangrovi]